MSRTSNQKSRIVTFGLTALTLAFLTHRTLAQQGNASGTWSGTVISVQCSTSPTSPTTCSGRQLPAPPIVFVHVGNTLTATLPEAGLSIRGFLVGESEQTLHFSLTFTFVGGGDEAPGPCAPGEEVGSGTVNLAENTFRITVTGINDGCKAETVRVALQRVG